MERKIGIIADDLTGANDSGVQLTEKGLNTSVLFQTKNGEDYLDAGLVINTDSRGLSPDAAFQVTMEAAEFLKRHEYKHIYKKMDSTIRGHFGTELQAMNEVFDPDFIFIAPAFPKLGRTTIHGIHYVHGVPVSETEIAKDPKLPVKDAYIPNLIENEIGKKVGLLRKEDYKEETVFQKRIEQFKIEGIQYLVIDAETEKDLLQAARGMAMISKNLIWAGSAGLAEVLPEVLQLTRDSKRHTYPNASQTLTVCGTLSGVTQNQVQYALKQPGIAGVEIDTLSIFSNGREKYKKEYLSTSSEYLEKGKDIILYLPSTDEVRHEVKKAGNEKGLSAQEVGEAISNFVGEIVQELVEKTSGLSGLVLTGGDTAKDTVKHIGGVGIQLIKEIEAGIPLGSLIGTEKDFTVVTKAGAFGQENSIYRAIQVLKGDVSDES